VDVPALMVECERASRQVAEQMQLRAEEDAQIIRKAKVEGETVAEIKKRI
jgi:hypothetical protein